MPKVTEESRPVAFGSAATIVGVSWQRRLGIDDTKASVIQALLQSIYRALKQPFEGRAVPRLDRESVSAMLTLRIPEPAGSVKVCDVSVSLLVEGLTQDVDADVLVVVPRIRVEIHRLQDGLRWLVRDADADVEQLTGELLEILDAVQP